MSQTKKRSKAKIIAIIAAVVVILGVAAFLLLRPKKNVSLFTEEEAVRRDIITYYAFSGNVETDKSISVLSEVSQKVLEVYVDEGDEVKAGDVIAILDSSDIEEDIEIKKINMKSSEINDSYNLKSARNTYEDYLAGINDGSNSQLSSAQKALDNASDSLDDAKEDYEEKLAEAEAKNIDNLTLMSARQSLEQARRKLESSKETYEEALEKYEGGTNSSLLSAQTSVEQARRRLNSAENDYHDYLWDEYEGDAWSFERAEEKKLDAKEKMDEAKKAYDEYRKEAKYGEEWTNAQQALDTAKAEYQAANTAYDEFYALVRNEDYSSISALKAAEDRALEIYNAKENKTLSELLNTTQKKYDEAVKTGSDNALIAELKAMNDELVEAAEKTADALKAEYEEAAKAYSDAKADIDAKNKAQLESLEKAQKESKEKFISAQSNYNRLKVTIDTTLEEYYNAYISAKDEYDDAVEHFEEVDDDMDDDMLHNYYESYLAAQESLDAAQRNLEDTQESIKKNVDSAYESYLLAQESYDSSAKKLTDTLKNLDSDLEDMYDRYVSAQESYDKAQEDLENIRTTVDQTLRTYKDNYEKTRQLQGLSTASYELDNLFEQLENCTIKATSDGTVSKINLEEGSYTSIKQTAAVITDYSRLKITIKIDEYDIAKIDKGANVEVYINAADEKVTGTIDVISPEAEVTGGVAYFKAEVSFESTPKIKPGMSAEVKFISQQAENAISIPIDALNYNADNSAYVLVKKGDRETERRDVTVGTSDGTYIEITEGLNENDVVLYVPSSGGSSGMMMGPMGMGGGMGDMGGMAP